ncbi:MmgE/PrpD family protein [Halobacillus sp. Marseille-P3879]|uniref:MmgE/PrpD family protein n=1 Tax=Halobacillus sp. Marseille-P3879 TaxID=2045014 RepID=UPI000C7DF64B|nr:MmgE/PrpD family protein [Halobacillus sp. Marseille-P3879]
MVTKKLIANCLSTTFNQIPEEVQVHGKRSLLNWLGAAIGAAEHSSIDMLVELSNDLSSSGEATIFGRREKSDISTAALVMGTASHIFDYDDTHLDTIHHPSGPVAPVVVALGEHLEASGEEALKAFILGCEAELRISNAVYPSHYKLGWHITSSTGVFGAAIAAGVLLGLDDDELSNAMGIAGTQAFGLRASFGTMAKPLHPGKAAQTGLLSALLAQKGFTGSQEILEAKRGFANVLAPEHELEKVNFNWGEDWELLKNTFKPYACGIVLHPSIDACIYFKERISFEELKSIQLTVNPYVLELTGNRNPKTGLEGKFSIYFAAAAAFIYGEAGFKQFTDDIVCQQNIQQVQRKIQVKVDETIKEEQVVARAELFNGETMEYKVDHTTGSLLNPMKESDLTNKFNELAGEWMEQSQIRDIVSKLLDLENLPSINELTELNNFTVAKRFH